MNELSSSAEIFLICASTWMLNSLSWNACLFFASISGDCLSSAKINYMLPSEWLSPATLIFVSFGSSLLSASSTRSFVCGHRNYTSEVYPWYVWPKKGKSEIEDLMSSFLRASFDWSSSSFKLLIYRSWLRWLLSYLWRSACRLNTRWRKSASWEMDKSLLEVLFKSSWVNTTALNTRKSPKTIETSMRHCFSLRFFFYWCKIWSM